MSIPSVASSVSMSSSLSPTNERIIYNSDIFDDFIEMYYTCDIKVQSVLLDTIINYVKHPAYTHLLRTMDRNNYHHVIGYLRSQRSYELYTILDKIMRNPLPTKEDFIHGTYAL
jgi:hypothetical protein